MNLAGLWSLLHLFFTFSFVGSLMISEWNGRAARATEDWRERALLFHIIHLASRVGGFGSLLLLGVFGNLAAMAEGYRMATDVWMRWANGMWLVTVLVAALLTLPRTARLAAIAREARDGGSADAYAPTLAQWRIGNVIMSLLYLALLGLMVFRWR